MARRPTTTQTMEASMEAMLLVYGYQGVARYIRSEIEIGFHLSDGVLMKLMFPDTATPDAAVTQAVSVLDKINGIQR